MKQKKTPSPSNPKASGSQTHKTPTQLLRADHKKVKGLFVEFEKSKSFNHQKEIFETVVKELNSHMTVEKEIFYPMAREVTGDDELLDEAREEHHVVDLLIEEIENLDLEEEENQEVFCAKFTVLAENARHHIKEEEEDMFPQFEKADIDEDDFAQQMEEKKSALEHSEKLGTALTH